MFLICMCIVFLAKERTKIASPSSCCSYPSHSSCTSYSCCSYACCTYSFLFLYCFYSYSCYPCIVFIVILAILIGHPLFLLNCQSESFKNKWWNRLISYKFINKQTKIGLTFVRLIRIDRFPLEMY